MTCWSSVHSVKYDCKGTCGWHFGEEIRVTYGFCGSALWLVPVTWHLVQKSQCDFQLCHRACERPWAKHLVCLSVNGNNNETFPLHSAHFICLKNKILRPKTAFSIGMLNPGGGFEMLLVNHLTVCIVCCWSVENISKRHKNLNWLWAFWNNIWFAKLPIVLTGDSPLVAVLW